MDRRWIGWALGGALVALVAFAPFRDSGGSGDRQGTIAGDGSAVAPAGPGGAPAGTDGGTDDGGSAGSGTGAGAGSTSGTGGRGGESTSGASPSDAGGPTGGTGTPAPEVPELPAPTERELAVLGPLIAAMDTGQRAGTPLVLGVATSILATGLPGDEQLPPELRPVLAAVADLIATPGAQVNQLTAQNSVQLAQLDRALGELAYLNPALNAAIHATADQLATFGRAAEPVSPPGGVFLSDLSVLLTYFVVD